MRPLLLAVAVLVLSAALAACGGSDGPAATTRAAGTATTIGATTKPEKTKPAKGKAFQIKVPSSAPIGATSPPKVIKDLQKALKMLGFDVGTPDGIWGAKTRRAVVKFQKQHKLTADGLVGLATAKAINKELKQQA